MHYPIGITLPLGPCPTRGSYVYLHDLSNGQLEVEASDGSEDPPTALVLDRDEVRRLAAALLEWADTGRLTSDPERLPDT